VAQHKGSVHMLNGDSIFPIFIIVIFFIVIGAIISSIFPSIKKK